VLNGSPKNILLSSIPADCACRTPLISYFTPIQIEFALVLWCLDAIVTAAIMVIRFEQKPLHALGGGIVGMMLTIALVGVVGSRQVEISPLEIRSLFSESSEFNPSASAKFEVKESLFHTEIDSGSQWSYRAFFIKVQDSCGSRYFYVLHQSADGTIPTEVHS